MGAPLKPFTAVLPKSRILPMLRLLPVQAAFLKPLLLGFTACVFLSAAASASGQQIPPSGDEGLSLRGTARFGAEAPVVWSLVSAEVAGNTLTLKLSDEKGAAAGDVNITPWISPWPHRKQQRGGLAVGLPAQRLRPGVVTITGSRSLEPFGPVQRLVVQGAGAKLPSMMIQTRGQSGQLVIAGWRAVYTGSRWEIREVVRKDARGIFAYFLPYLPPTARIHSPPTSNHQLPRLPACLNNRRGQFCTISLHYQALHRPKRLK